MENLSRCGLRPYIPFKSADFRSMNHGIQIFQRTSSFWKSCCIKLALTLTVLGIKAVAARLTTSNNVTLITTNEVRLATLVRVA